MSNLQPNCCLKFDFQKVDQHASIIDHNDRSCDYLRLVLRLMFFNSIESHDASYDQSCDHHKNSRSLRLHYQVVENHGD